MDKDHIDYAIQRSLERGYFSTRLGYTADFTFEILDQYPRFLNAIADEIVIGVRQDDTWARYNRRDLRDADPQGRKMAEYVLQRLKEAQQNGWKL